MKWIVSFLLILPFSPFQDHLVHNKDRIVFFGDSITMQASRAEGFISLIRDSLLRNVDSIDVVNAGISGNKVPDLKKRLQADVLDKKPNVVVIYIGINDVWHNILPGLKGTPPDEFEDLLCSIIVTIRKNGVPVILCTPSVVGERHNGQNRLDADLDAYAAISRRVAKQLALPLCDLRAAFLAYLKAHNPDNKESGILTYDKVHLSDAGNRLVATELLNILAK
jgi:lysophospholipase L1-like esterase